MWPTWEKNAELLIGSLDTSKSNLGFPVKVKEVRDIRPAFEFIAGDLMGGGDDVPGPPRRPGHERGGLGGGQQAPSCERGAPGGGRPRRERRRDRG